jgi:hypothetical protein
LLLKTLGEKSNELRALGHTLIDTNEALIGSIDPTKKIVNTQMDSLYASI